MRSKALPAALLLVASCLLAACGTAAPAGPVALAPEQVMSFRGLQFSRAVEGREVLRASVDSVEITKGHLWFFTCGLFHEAHVTGLKLRLDSAGPEGGGSAATGPVGRGNPLAGGLCLREMLPGLKDVRGVTIEGLRIEVHRGGAPVLTIASRRGSLSPTGGLRLEGGVCFEGGGRRLECSKATWDGKRERFTAEAAELSCGGRKMVWRRVCFDPALKNIRAMDGA